LSSSVGFLVERYSSRLRDSDCGGANDRIRARPSRSLCNNYDSLGIDWEWAVIMRIGCIVVMPMWHTCRKSVSCSLPR
jgi:hypothetical protein